MASSDKVASGVRTVCSPCFRPVPKRKTLQRRALAALWTSLLIGEGVDSRRDVPGRSVLAKGIEASRQRREFVDEGLA